MHRDFNAIYERLSPKGKNAFEMSVSAIELTENFFRKPVIIEDEKEMLADGKREAVC